MSDIIDVAKLAKVSIATVSRYLNTPDIVKPSTQKRIKEAIDELGYRPSPIARNMRKQESKYIAMLLEDMSNPFYTEVLNGAEFAAIKHGYNIVVLNINKEEEKKDYYFDLIYRRGFIGAIYCFTMNEEDEKLLINLKNKGVHFCLIENELFKDKYVCINTNNYSGGYEGAKFLIGKKHKKIAIVSADSFFDQMNARKAGFIDALNDNTLEYDPDLFFYTDLSIDGGMKIGEKILDKKDEFSAIFSFSDIISIGLMKYLRKNGIRVPQDVSILSFDDIEWSKIVEPPLTTIHQRKRKLGLEAVECILKSINGNDSQDSIILDTYIVERETVKDMNK